MGSQEKVLSIDLEENDFLYRIRRDSRVVYVSVLHGDIIPPDCRTDGSRILSQLRNVPRWEEEWMTLTVRKTPKGAESEPDEFLPHGLDLKNLDVSGAIFYNILDLNSIFRISDRISRVKLHDQTWVLKIARFRHEVPALQREVAAYSVLSSQGFLLAPKFIGFAYEETKHRTVGFLMEDISGRVPDIRDLDQCMETVCKLHKSGIIHGDLNRYNFMMTQSGAKIFDFENSTTRGCAGTGAADEEIRTLASKLEDESEIGKR